MDALCTGRWPHRCEDGLRTHVRACDVCRDVADAAGPLIAQREVSWSGVRVPAAGAVWHGARLRARQEAVRQAARPMTVAQVAALVAALALAGALGVLFAPEAGAWMAHVADVLAIGFPRLDLRFDVPRLDLPRLDLLALSAADPLWPVVVVTSAVWILLAPVALYLALREE
jgi:hypothetical protein